MKKWSLSVLLLIGLLGGFWSGPAASHAQQSQPPVIGFSGGDLWTWTPAGDELAPLTQDAYVQAVALSPDGTRLAYLAWAPISIATVKQSGGIGGGPLPSDIGVIDPQTGKNFMVAEQPAGSVFTLGPQDSATVRSKPAWSPDGTKLAWTELHYPSSDTDTVHLLIGDLNSRTSQTIVSNIPLPVGVPVPPDVLWSRSGLALLNYGYDTNTSANIDTVTVYNPDGSTRSSASITEDDQHRLDFITWVTQGNQDLVGVHYFSGSWDVIDPASGSRQPASGTPERYSLLAASQSLALTFTQDPKAADFNTSYQWTVTAPGGQPVTPGIHVSPDSVALSPDGQTIAYISDNLSPASWKNGQTSVSSHADSSGAFALLFWGPVGWRIGQGQATQNPLPIPTVASQPATCPGALPTRLIVGEKGELIPNTNPNNVRAQPGKSGAKVGTIKSGDIFTVVAGPQCVDGMNWWQVTVNGLTGWTAEGDNQGYWIEPLGL